MIKRGAADVMIAGGSEAAVCRLGIAGFCAARSLSTSYNDEPHLASRPWDIDRDGFVMGEGSGIIVLEEFEYAKRGANIYAELVGTVCQEMHIILQLQLKMVMRLQSNERSN